MSGNGYQPVKETGTATVLDIEAWTASETFWTRLEPRTRDPQIERPLRAEVHDPAWLLCRQWQVGEFQGEDAGSPVTAAVSYAQDYLSRYELGGIDYSELLPGPGGSDLPITPPPTAGGPGSVPVADERDHLDAVTNALGEHLDAQRTGGGEPADAQAAFETYLQPGSGQTPSQRRQALAYLTVPVPDDDDGTESTFADRALGYLANQPRAETQVGGDGVDQLVAELVAYAEGSASWQAAATTVAVLLQAGGQGTTRHLLEVLAIARSALQDYDTAGSGGSGSSGEDGSPDRTVAGNGRPYDGEPLEVLVEREPVTTGLSGSDVPPARLRGDAGQTYLRFLAREDVTPADGTYAAADLVDPTAGDPERFLLDDPDTALDPDDLRFVSLTDGRAVDGHAVYTALVAGVPGIRDAAGWEAPSWPGSADGLPLPQGESLSDGVKRAATGFVDWYADLYDEPESGANPAWQDDRQEHQFSVATGPAEGETVLKAEEYPGGHLDWYSFSVASGPLDSLSPPSEADANDLSRSKSKDVTLSRLRYRGMPASRWWAFEDAAVNLDDIPAGPEELSKLLLLDFSLVHGDDWFIFPLSVPIGTLTRITEMTVTDTFGETTDIEPVTSVTDRWNAFSFPDLPADVTKNGEPGLFLPPTLAESQSSDAVERVSFARDEMANLAFAVEERVESPVGSPQEREEFVDPDLAIDRVVAGPDEQDERLVVRNVGDAPLDVTGWTVEVTVGTTTVGQPTDELYRFTASDDGEPAVLDADETVTIHTGEAPAGVPPEGHVYLGGLTDHATLSAPVWGNSVGSVVVRRAGDGTPDERFVARDVVAHTPVDLPEYELASAVPDHYFAMQPVRPKTGDDAAPVDPDSYRLALALLLDADSMGDPLQRLPTPKGRILDTDDPLRLYEEEVTRAGRDVERHYQLARWTDGSTHLWSSRRVATGAGEIASRLRYDDIVEPDEQDLSAGTGGDTT